MKRFFLWSRDGEKTTRRGFHQPVWLVRDPAGRAFASDDRRDDCVEIRPLTDAMPGGIALVLVPSAVAGRLARNGILLPAGEHWLRHADLLELDSRAYWLDVEFAAEESVYDAAVHPADALCFFSHARLSPGEAIVICPGTSEVSCGMIYRKSAWLAAQESAVPFRCAHCGFAPGRAEWSPPAPRSARSLSRLLRLVAQEPRPQDARRECSP